MKCIIWNEVAVVVLWYLWYLDLIMQSMLTCHHKSCDCEFRSWRYVLGTTLGTDHLTWRGGGGYGFLFRSEFFFSDNTRVRIFFFFLSRKARIFFPDSNIRLYDKNSESYFFFFLHQNQNIFFSNIGNHHIFLEKTHTPLPPLQVKWSFPCVTKYISDLIQAVQVHRFSPYQ